MNTSKETFSKTERLCSIKTISHLFENGNVFYTSLFKVVWEISPASIPFPSQITFSVSKKGFKHAVTRNLLKRRMRESFRKNKISLYEHLLSENIQIVLVVIYKSNSITEYAAIEKSMKEIINKLITLNKRL
jgi:ribonuclease P protein component